MLLFGIREEKNREVWLINMEKQKKQLLLLLGVLVLVVAAWFGVSLIPEEDETEETMSYQVSDLEKDAVTKLTYTNEQGTFSFIKEGEEWSYEADKNVDIEESTIENMIGKLASYASENQITEVEELSTYGLDEPKYTILLSDGTTSYTMFVGDYNTTTYTYYMCLENDPATVYTVKSSDVAVYGNVLEDLIAEEETEGNSETVEVMETEEMVETTDNTEQE